MPFYPRRTNRRKRLNRRPRRTVLRRRYPLRRKRQTKVHQFKRVCQLSNIILSNAQVANAITFKLADLPDYSDFTNLFDQYRIKGIKLQFVPNVDSAPIGQAAGMAPIGIHRLHTVIDRDDADVPTTPLDLMQYDTYKWGKADRIHKRYFKPNTLEDSDEGSNTQGWNKWISTESANVPYYGIKYIFDPLDNASNGIVFNVYATYYIQCKAVI